MSNRAKLSRENRIKRFEEKVFQVLKLLEERIDVLQSDVEGIKEILDEESEEHHRSGRAPSGEASGTVDSGSEDVSEGGSFDLPKTEGENNAPVPANGGVESEYRG